MVIMMNNMKNAQVKFAGRLSSQKTSEMLRRIAEVFLKDPRFQNTPIKADAITRQADATDSTEKSLAEVKQQGQSLRAQRRQLQADTVVMMRALGVFVQLVSGGDPHIIAEAQFPVRRAQLPIGPLTRPERLTAKPTAKAGEAVVRWKRVPGAKSYHVERSDNPSVASGWTRVATVPRAKFDATGLPTTRVYFRVLAVGTSGDGPCSDVASCQAQ